MPNPQQNNNFIQPDVNQRSTSSEAFPFPSEPTAEINSHNPFENLPSQNLNNNQNNYRPKTNDCINQQLPNPFYNVHSNPPYQSYYPHHYPYRQSPNVNFPRRGLTDWNIQYDGSTSIERFLMKVEFLRKTNGYSYDYVISQFHSLLTKSAGRWYWSWVTDRQKEDVVITWEILTNALILHFGSVKSDDDISRLLEDKRQKPSEKFASYFEDFMTIHDGLKVPKSQQSLIKILKRNVSNRLYTLIHGIESPTVDAFAFRVGQIEYDLDMRSQWFPSALNKYRDGKKVNELQPEEENDEDESETKEIEEFRVNGNGFKDRSKRSSPNQRDNKDLHCYKCGNPGYTVPNCPKCQAQENSLERGNAVGTNLSQ